MRRMFTPRLIPACTGRRSYFLSIVGSFSVDPRVYGAAHTVRPEAGHALRRNSSSKARPWRSSA